MSDDVSGMAAVLIAHLRNYGQLSCACDGPGGWNTYPTDPDHAAHVAAALAKAGYGHVGKARAEALREAADAMSAQLDTQQQGRPRSRWAEWFLRDRAVHESATHVEGGV